MTEKLYYKDAYIQSFTATVLSCEGIDKGYDVVLDKTAFFPEEGGQYSDTGVLGGQKVSQVYERNLTVHHICDAPLGVGDTVEGKINFDERYEKMQCHSAEHILSGLFHKYFALENVGFHLGREDVTMDISSPLSRAELDEIERLANEIVYKNVQITTLFPSSNELNNYEYRSKLDLRENVRIVFIGEYDACACCAPHVSATGEIGAIKILDFEKLRGGMRLHILAGRRAMRYYDELYKNALRISAMLSMPKGELPGAVDALLLSQQKLKSEYDSFRLNTYIEKGNEITATDKNAVLYLEGATPAELREVANMLMERVGGYLVLLSGTEGSLQYVLATSKGDVKSDLAAINSELCGRGGGKGQMAQGVFATDVETVKSYFA